MTSSGSPNISQGTRKPVLSCRSAGPGTDEGTAQAGHRDQASGGRTHGARRSLAVRFSRQ